MSRVADTVFGVFHTSDELEWSQVFMDLRKRATADGTYIPVCVSETPDFGDEHFLEYEAVDGDRIIPPASFILESAGLVVLTEAASLTDMGRYILRQAKGLTVVVDPSLERAA